MILFLFTKGVHTSVGIVRAIELHVCTYMYMYLHCPISVVAVH